MKHARIIVLLLVVLGLGIAVILRNTRAHELVVVNQTGATIVVSAARPGVVTDPQVMEAASEYRADFTSGMRLTIWPAPDVESESVVFQLDGEGGIVRIRLEGGGVRVDTEGPSVVAAPN